MKKEEKINKRNEIISLHKEGLSNKEIFNKVKDKYNLTKIYQVSAQVNRYNSPTKGKSGEYNSQYQEIDLDKLKELILQGKNKNELKKIFNKSQNIINSRAKELRLYERLKENVKLNQGKNNGNYRNIETKEMNKIIETKEMNKIIDNIMNNKLYSLKDIKYHELIYKKLRDINREDVLVKLKQNGKNVIRQRMLNNNPNFVDGKSRKLLELKKKTLLKQNYKCKVCNCDIVKSKQFHHLDLDEENNVEENTVYLCSKHHNHIHQRGYNYHKKTWSINVNEIFASLQGEGLNCGKSTLFWRNSHCNLFCNFCDSKYSWTTGKKYNIKEVVKKLKEYKVKGQKRLCITGGEPFFQNIEPLVLIAKCLDYYIEVETNGTIIPVRDLQYIDNYNVSIKLSSSGVKEEKRIKSKVIEHYNMIGNAYFKFVVGNIKDMNEVKELEKKYNIKRNKIYLMPLTVSNKKERQNINEFVWNICLLHNYKYSPRLHVDVWGTKKRKI